MDLHNIELDSMDLWALDSCLADHVPEDLGHRLDAAEVTLAIEPYHASYLNLRLKVARELLATEETDETVLVTFSLAELWTIVNSLNPTDYQGARSLLRRAWASISEMTGLGEAAPELDLQSTLDSASRIIEESRSKAPVEGGESLSA